MIWLNWLKFTLKPEVLMWTVLLLDVVVSAVEKCSFKKKKKQPANHQMRPLRSIVLADIAHPSHCSSRLCPHFSLNSRSLHISWPHSRYLCSDFHSDSLGSVFIFLLLERSFAEAACPFYGNCGALWSLLFALQLVCTLALGVACRVPVSPVGHTYVRM